MNSETQDSTEKPLTFQEQLKLMEKAESWVYSRSTGRTAKSRHLVEQFEGELEGLIKLRLQRHVVNSFKRLGFDIKYSLEVTCADLDLPREYFFEDHNIEEYTNGQNRLTGEEAQEFSREIKRLFSRLKREHIQQGLVNIRDYLAQ
jgi:hypothetical protein